MNLDKSIRHLSLISLLAVGVATSRLGVAQTWTETNYSVTRTTHTESLNSFIVYNGPLTWGVTVYDHFIVTGSATQDPSWRTLFANLCSNTWAVSQTFSDNFLGAGTVTNKRDYYTRTGNNAFSHDYPLDTASRNLDENVTDALYYVFVNEPGNGGGGS